MEPITKINNVNKHAICIGNGNIFESSWYMRGFEQMLMDLVLEPDLAWDIMTRDIHKTGLETFIKQTIDIWRAGGDTSC